MTVAAEREHNEENAMSSNSTPVKVVPGSEVDRLLDAAAHMPVLLEKAGALYRVHRVETADPFASYDPEAVRASIRAVAGILTVADAERIKAEIYRAREEGTRPE
jgi:hypothetical protein